MNSNEIFENMNKKIVIPILVVTIAIIVSILIIKSFQIINPKFKFHMSNSVYKSRLRLYFGIITPTILK
jgi:uncharacterized membrane protein YGL010W